MIWFYVAAGLTVLSAAVQFVPSYDSLGKADTLSERILSAIGAIFVVGLITGICAVFMNVFFMNYDYEAYERVGTVADLEALADGQSVHGHFFLGTGSIDSYPSYTYYVKNADGSYALETLSEDDLTWGNTISVFQDDSTPRLDCTYTVVKRGHKSNFWSIWGPSIDAEGCDSYMFHVPPGSIVSGYRLDAQ